MWFYYALLAALLWGIGQVIVKKGQTSLTPYTDNVLATVVQVFILVPFLFFLGINPKEILPTLPYAFLVALLYMTYYYVINQGQISLTGTLLSAYPAVTIFLSFIFLHEKLTFLQIFSIVAILIGTIILALPKQIPHHLIKKPKAWVVWGIFGILMIGLVQFFTKLGTENGNANTFTFLMGLSYLPALLLCGIFDKKKSDLRKIKWKKSSLLLSVIGVAMIELDLIPLNLAFATGPASLVSPVIATNVVIMLILSIKFLKEHLSKMQYLGIVITIVGILFIGAY